ncbi:MAG: hypothetical protein IJL12_05515, partial [Selenomonadaceae bacterium]|nr:hypothetical protein [Selenomonadaceae bacterium]
LLQNAEPLVDYRLNYVLANVEHSTPQGKFKALQEILPVVTKVETDATRNEYRKKIAAALSLDEFILTREWKKFSKTESEKKSAAKVAKRPENTNPVVKAASEDILRMVWQESDMLDYALTLVPREIFSEVHREIITWIENCVANERRPDKMSAATELSEAANAELARILMSGPNTNHDIDVSVFKDSVKVLRQIVLDKKYFQLLAQADNYNPNDEATYVQTVQKSLKIKKESDNLKSNYTCF